MTSFRSHKLLHRIVLGNLLVAALLCFATWLGVHANYRADMDLGVAVTRHQARSLSLELAAEVRLVDNALSSIASRYRARSFDGLAAANFALYEMLHEQRALIPFVTALRITDSAGEVLITPSEIDVPFSVAERAYFAQAREADRMVVSEPLISHSFGKWSIVLARRLQAEGGQFQGIVYAIVAAEHFHQLFQRQSFGTSSAMALRTDQALLVARYPAATQDADAGIGKAAVSSEYHQAISRNSEEGWYITPTLIDGVERITAYHRLPGYPLTVFTGLGTEAYMAMWRASAWRAWGLTGLCIALIALGSVALYRLQQRERRIRKEQELVINNDLIGMARLRERKIVWTNPAMRRLLKQPAAALQGASTRMLYPDEASYRRIGEKAYASLLARGKFHAQFQVQNAEGKLLWVDASGTLLNAEESLWILVDIDALKQGEQAANHLANHDALTGLANRRALEETLNQELADGQMLAVCFMDLDGFKQVNDTQGHDAGDEVLRVVAARLTAQARAGDCVARLGGDEFVVLLSGLRTSGEAMSVMKRCMEAVRQPIALDGGVMVQVGSSIGISISTAGSSSANLMQSADEAMYSAKHAGKGRIVQHSDLSQDSKA
ncbi:sensor domain-containing diguanylate cyclase [Comamonas testosteroni]|uniref:Cyclic di-GMP phosphodiesterase Gmr n=1 Tax=Comamonas testosteroni TaxID=285 RepID=A0A8B4S2U2_COMTE|nr:sensor domain-containing diguanylate cyclase [Comamonas testosteroni]EHN64049.1 diguanylate cyclase [Comamonas testosteroni ATCC 11996]QQN69193.1 GGDEF domain-containing protein [Comamonas testosteroni]SUY77434.1 Cyclic di-GMP phosphodiesterase Gmr [Comamonas testosteroni]